MNYLRLLGVPSSHFRLWNMEFMARKIHYVLAPLRAWL